MINKVQSIVNLETKEGVIAWTHSIYFQIVLVIQFPKWQEPYIISSKPYVITHSHSPHSQGLLLNLKCSAHDTMTNSPTFDMSKN